MIKLKKSVIDDLLLAARNTYPNEFFAYLGGDKKTNTVDEFILAPAVYGKTFVMIKEYLMPFDSRIMGSIHSHPGKSNFPSKADVNSFGKKGEIHLIIAFPYTLNSIQAYDEKGIKTEFELIE
ncbi:MAG: Mov34/MPN/PAD-1 family protein [Candidatus Diapherotrites archaeon]|nr:Mov34/MPN/PAD-1 family protein [Candidatus Diapherotrites archaeon]